MTVGVGCDSRPCATEANGPVMRLRYHWAPRLVARRSCDGKTPAPIEAEALSVQQKQPVLQAPDLRSGPTPCARCRR